MSFFIFCEYIFYCLCVENMIETRNLYVNKYVEIIQRTQAFPDLAKVIKLGFIKVKDILYVNEATIAEANKKSSANTAVLTQKIYVYIFVFV